MRGSTDVFTLTLALRDAGGTIEIGGCVAGAGNAVILPELCLIGAHGAADAAVDRGVVVMTGRALDCRERGKKSLFTGFLLHTFPPPPTKKPTDLCARYCRLLVGRVKTVI